MEIIGAVIAAGAAVWAAKKNKQAQAHADRKAAKFASRRGRRHGGGSSFFGGDSSPESSGSGWMSSPLVWLGAGVGVVLLVSD